jgi:uncharacterized protein (TIGR02271 family)
MTMNDIDYSGWVGHTLVDSSRDKVGEVTDIYADDATGQPEWIAVKTGMFGSNISFVPLAGATARGDDLQVAYSKQQVKDAPNAEADGHLSQDEESRLYTHYGLDYETGWSQQGTADRGDVDRDIDIDRDRRSSDDAMTRSEEELRVGKEQREAGRARLRKYVVTEQETRTVPVTREEVYVEREPITDGNVGDALEGPDISEAEHEVVLHEERPVVSTETVAKERVRLGTDTVTDEETVSGEVRKERIDTEGVSER